MILPYVFLSYIFVRILCNIVEFIVDEVNNKYFALLIFYKFLHLWIFWKTYVSQHYLFWLLFMLKIYKCCSQYLINLVALILWFYHICIMYIYIILCIYLWVKLEKALMGHQTLTFIGKHTYKWAQKLRLVNGLDRPCRWWVNA